MNIFERVFGARRRNRVWRENVKLRLAALEERSVRKPRNYYKIQFPEGTNSEILSKSDKVFEVEDLYFYTLATIDDIACGVDEDDVTHLYLPNKPLYRIQDDERRAHPERYQHKAEVAKCVDEYYEEYSKERNGNH